MMQLWIVGGSGAALESWAVAQTMTFERKEPAPLAGFLVIEPPSFDPQGLQVRLESDFLATADPAFSLVVLALGSPSLRQRVAESYRSRGFRFATLVHPTAVIGPEVSLGEGCVVMAHAVLETHVRVGAHCFINVQASLAHECVVGEACSLGPGVHLAGQVTLGDRCDLGVGAVVRPRITLGDDVVVGAGAAVVKNHPGPAVLVGVPARPLPSENRS
jgi:UDP-perosamine 4-acetyltransferase